MCPCTAVAVEPQLVPHSHVHAHTQTHTCILQESHVLQEPQRGGVEMYEKLWHFHFSFKRCSCPQSVKMNYIHISDRSKSQQSQACRKAYTNSQSSDERPWLDSPVDTDDIMVQVQPPVPVSYKQYSQSQSPFFTSCLNVFFLRNTNLFCWLLNSVNIFSCHSYSLPGLPLP